MINIITKVIIKHKSPHQIFNFLTNLDTEKYKKMCPSAHKEFKIVIVKKNVIGTIYYFHEVVGNLNLHKNWVVTNAKENKFLSQKVKWFYPVNLNLSFKEIPQGTELIHDLQIGFHFLQSEKIIDWFIRKFVLTDKQIKILEHHAIEEFTSLEYLI